MKIDRPAKTDTFIGSKFGKLTVIDFSFYKEKQKSPNSQTGRMSYWLCRCECGKEKNIANCNLLSGGTTSCGCNHIERVKDLHKKSIKLDAPFKSLFKEYQNGAKSRNLEWDISEEKFKEITSLNCCYCGEVPSKIRDRNGGNVFKGIPYVYNGIDRVDNKLGYIEDNIVPCCWMCNMLKGTFGKEEFLNKIKKIYENLENPCNMGSYWNS